jgi:putative membrane protein
MVRTKSATLLVALACLLSLTATARPAGDEDFAMKAAKDGKMEVELGRLAMRKARNAAVKNFGRRMTSDHTLVGNKLHAIAVRKRMALPADLDADQKAELDRFAQMTRNEFDRAYMQKMVSDHESAVSDFKTEADSGGDRQLRSFAATTLPTLRTHLRMARQTLRSLR